MQHSAKNFLFFSKFFAECHSAEALGKAYFYFFLNFLCRVPLPRHSAKHFLFFFKLSLPSAMAIALGKSGKLLLLFSQLCRVQWSLHSAKPQQFFFCFLLFHVNNSAYIYIKNHNSTQYIRNHIYISQTTNYVRNPQYITNHKFTSSIHKGMPT